MRLELPQAPTAHGYVTGVLETIVTIGASTIGRNLSYKGTHIVERMSLLTLIILGEGVIGLASK